MTISLTHAFVSAKSDGGDATLVQPSNWNAGHTVTAALNKVLGTDGSSTTVQELACTSQGRSILSAADLNALATAIAAGFFTSGDAKLTLKTTADTGWVMMDDGTIGDGSSGASTRANADCSALFGVIWAIGSAAGIVISDSAGVASTYGANAAADFAAHKRLALPKELGRAIVVGGTGSGLTARTLATTFGAETNTLTQPNLPNVTIGAGTLAVGLASGTPHVGNSANNVTTGGPSPLPVGDASPIITGSTASINGNVAQTTINNMQPSAAWNVMLKL